MRIAVAVSGSLAFDRIFDYPGRFKDAINPKKLHQLNVSFMVDSVQDSFGGTAGNIGYSLSLLGVRSMVVAAAGNDFISYHRWLTGHSVDCSGITVHKAVPTASALIITDKDDNQITVFHPGALACSMHAENDRVRRILRTAQYAIIAPDNPLSMVRMSTFCRTAGVPYLFDPGQQLTALKRAQLRSMIAHADGVISNDYELSLLTKTSGLTLPVLRRSLRYVVTTLGAKGSLVYHGNTLHTIPPVRPASVIDPTGAGDAYRSGFVTGLLATKSFPIAGRMGSLASVYTVEKQGTQTHAYSRRGFARRYQMAFSTRLSVI